MAMVRLHTFELHITAIVSVSSYSVRFLPLTILYAIVLATIPRIRYKAILRPHIRQVRQPFGALPFLHRLEYGPGWRRETSLAVALRNVAGALRRKTAIPDRELRRSVEQT